MTALCRAYAVCQHNELNIEGICVWAAACSCECEAVGEWGGGGGRGGRGSCALPCFSTAWKNALTSCGSE